jgi:type IV pilus assembly protein PilB
MATPKAFVDLLIRENVVSAAALEQVLAKSRASGCRIVDLLLAQNLVDEESLVRFMTQHFRIPVVDLSTYEMKPELLKILPSAYCLKYFVLPVGKRGETLVIATSDPSDVQALDDIRFQTKSRVEQVLAHPSAIRSVLERMGGVDLSRLAESMGGEQAETIDAPESGEIDVSDTDIGVDDAPIVQFVSAVLVDAIRRKASDIHVEPYQDDLRVRLRIDGDLRDTVRPPQNVRNALVARIKVMAKMRIDERRLPQDGRIRLRLPEGQEVDFRVNTLPTVNGEKVVLRILDKANAVLGFDQLGFEPDDLAKLVQAIKAPWGIVLVTGATGSGKTTTLYAALNSLNTQDVNISTIEDPVEYKFTGINQVQTKDQIGLTFAEALRALLRQDPDIILLGEIRDGETAEIAFKAALTGHLVLSTLHTNDAPSTIMRLKDMGMDPFLINSALLCVVAQRLVRRVCPDCKEPDHRWNHAEMRRLGFPEEVIGKFQPVKGRGCGKCSGTGFRGRCAIHEVLVIDDTIKEMVGKAAQTHELRKAALSRGMRTLRHNCMRKILRGLVSIEDLVTLGGD